jgi:hypothetical protein
MMLVAGRMTATARADIGARCSSPTLKRGPRFAYRRVMTFVSSDDDLDWEFAFDSRLGHPLRLPQRMWAYSVSASISPQRTFSCVLPIFSV